MSSELHFSDLKWLVGGLIALSWLKGNDNSTSHLLLENMLKLGADELQLKLLKEAAQWYSG